MDHYFIFERGDVRKLRNKKLQALSVGKNDNSKNWASFRLACSKVFNVFPNASNYVILDMFDNGKIENDKGKWRPRYVGQPATVGLILKHIFCKASDTLRVRVLTDDEQ